MYKSSSFLFFTLLLLCASTQATPSSLQQTTALLLTPYTANYEATWEAGWFPITIDATRTFEKVDDHWKLSFEAYSSVADLSEISHFQVTDNQVQPITYRYKTSGFLSKKLRNLEFNREENKVWLPYREIWADYDLTKETQDHISYQEQIRIDLMNGKTTFSYPVTYKARLKHYQFELVAEENIKTSNGTIRVVKVKQTGLNKKESNHIWFAKDYEFIIVKLKATKSNGTSNTIKLKQANIGNKVLTGL